MTQLKLVLSQNFDMDFAESVKAELGAHLDIEGPYFRFQKAAEPGLGPQLIQLIGGVVAWLPLSAAATVYLATLAKRAADATWDGLASLFKSKEVKSLAEVATTLAEAANAVEGDVEIVVGLDIPEENWGTAMVIRANSPEQIARALASFVMHAERLSKEMKAELAAGRTPLGRATIDLEEDGSLTVRWRSRKDFAECERRIP